MRRPLTSIFLLVSAFIWVWQLYKVFYQDESCQGIECTSPSAALADQSTTGAQVLRWWSSTTSCSSCGTSCEGNCGPSFGLHIAPASSEPTAAGVRDGALNVTLVRLVQKMVSEKCCTLRYMWYQAQTQHRQARPRGRHRVDLLHHEIEGHLPDDFPSLPRARAKGKETNPKKVRPHPRQARVRSFLPFHRHPKHQCFQR